MTQEELLALTKKSLRVTSTAFDSEIEQLIDAGKKDIEQATGITFDMSDSVQIQAVVVYCKANFGMNAKEKDYQLYQQRLQCIGLRNRSNT